MTVTNAIKKLGKAGFQIVGDYIFSASRMGSRMVIEFSRNGGGSEEVVCIRVRAKTDHDDSMTDYCAGVYCDSITQAIRLSN
jgi:hypothetical protein